VTSGISTKPEDVTMQNNNLLELAGAVSSGAVRVVDLTFTLSPDFPVIVLPPEFGQAAPVRIQEISRYDGRGPAWYWNNVTFGEHTGTHFDAPIHWFTGKNLPNNAVDTMPTKDMIAPACVIDCPARRGLGSKARPDPRAELGAAQDRLVEEGLARLFQSQG
jgi:kynurenine formamidase